MATQSTPSNDQATTSPQKKKRTTRWNRLPDKQVFNACQGLVRGMKLEDIALMISRELGEKIYRTQVNKVITEGMNRGFLQLDAPIGESLADDLRNRFDNATEEKVIKVVVQSYDVSLAPVAAAGAKSVLAVARECFERKKAKHKPRKREDPGPEPVRIGFGAGMTMKLVALNLAETMRTATDRPRVNIHSLTAGFRNDEPQNAPNSFCNFFHDMPEVTHTALYATPYVESKDWKGMRENLPGVSDSYKAAREVDIIVTSLASAQDAHGELTRFFDTYEEQTSKTKRQLEAAGRVGDVLHRPFSDSDPIRVKSELRAAALYELAELVQFAKTKNKFVILVAGPCGSRSCREPRHLALRPLLTSANLDLWTHLVTDDITVRRCIEST